MWPGSQQSHGMLDSLDIEPLFIASFRVFGCLVLKDYDVIIKTLEQLCRELSSFQSTVRIIWYHSDCSSDGPYRIDQK